jgi:hypothetical protein
MDLRKGQNLAEAALIIGVLGLVLVGMQVYVKRGLQGRVKDLTDNIIGSEQASHPQDTSMLKVNTVNSSLSSNSSATTIDSQGGARDLTGGANSTYTYNSTTQDYY